MAAMSLAAAAPGRLRRALRTDGLDAIHFPLSIMLPPLDAPPAATTVLDVQHEVFPEFFSRAELAYRRRVYGWTLRKSRIVITISEHAREALVERLHLDPARVRAIHLAVDHDRFTPDSRDREPFLLYPANAWKHKNHERLFTAFAQVHRERPGLRLVLTGAGHDRLTLPAGAESRGHVGLGELVDLYRSAAALVYPSLYEGFGIPCVEAMACGCPVAASDVASIPEVCGDAAVYFDPLDAESVAEGIRTVLDRPPSGGIERAAGFTWDACARAHDDVYEELAATA
jgi:glycosyltransferase involved in cell wall biosynthesis